MAIAEKEITGTELPLDSLEIKGYRAFKELTIPKLARVNLITGKNNVGKTSLLEAVYLYARHGAPSVIRDILKAHGELGDALTFSAPFGFRSNTAGSAKEDWMPYVPALLYGRRTIFELSDQEIEVGLASADGRKLRLAVKWGIPSSEPAGKPEFLSLSKASDLGTALEAIPYIVIQAPGKPEIYLAVNQQVHGVLYWLPNDLLPVQAVFSRGISGEDLVTLWDRIAITDLEKDVIRALQIIAPPIDRITFAFSDESRTTREPYVGFTESSEKRYPLYSQGDGLRHVLNIVLAATNARDGVVLIDEIENGLHYSVLVDVWKVILELAARLNVQVFATTHSWECIQAFQKALESDPSQGEVIRLRDKNGKIEATIIEGEELGIITSQEIEVR